MATTKNITMKQFNGTDYDTLYPKTNVEQVENLTPSSIGAVAKTGDTMTGTLTVQNASYPDINLKNTGSGSATKIRNTAHRTQIMSQEDDSNYRALTLHDKSATTSPLDILQIQQIEGGSQQAVYKVLHTGNLSGLGVARIATGSYVGTGTKGPNNKNSLTFSFNPKFVAIWEDGTVVANLYVFTVEKSTYSVVRSSGSLEPTHCTFDGKTLLWWTGSDSGSTSGDALLQANGSGITYDYVAFG